MPIPDVAPGLADAVSAAAKMPLAGFGLAFARTLGLLQILPVATRLGLRGLHRGGVAAALALPAVPLVLHQLGGAPPEGARLLLLAAKESVVGFALGVVFAAPFWAAETAGELIDQQRGSRGATVPDPAQLEESGITATLLVLTTVTIFILSNGMHWLFETVFASYRVFPADLLLPHIVPGAGTELLHLLDGVLGAGLVLAAPMLIAMVLAEFGLALVSRFAPSLNVFDLAMSFKGLVQVIGLPIYALFLVGYLRGGMAPLAGFAARLPALGGGG